MTRNSGRIVLAGLFAALLAVPGAAQAHDNHHHKHKHNKHRHHYDHGDCHDYRHTAYERSQRYVVYGTECLKQDSAWRNVSESNVWVPEVVLSIPGGYRASFTYRDEDRPNLDWNDNRRDWHYRHYDRD